MLKSCYLFTDVKHEINASEMIVVWLLPEQTDRLELVRASEPNGLLTFKLFAVNSEKRSTHDKLHFIVRNTIALCMAWFQVYP